MQKLKLAFSAGIIGFCGSASAADDSNSSHVAIEDLDSNGDGVISFVEFQASLNGSLSRFDTDLNDVLTLDEFLDAQPSRGPRSANRGDGSDSPSESGDRGKRMRERMIERAIGRFHAMDTDGDEVVTLAEFQEANFERIDSDKDGVLSEAEMQDQRHEPRRSRRGPRGNGGTMNRNGGQSST